MGIKQNDVLKNLQEANQTEALKACMDIIADQSEKINSLLKKNWYDVNFMEVAEILNDGVLILDNKGIIVNCNQKFSELTNMKKEELINRDIRGMIARGYFDEEIIFEVLKGRTIKNIYSEKLVKNRMHLMTGIPFVSEDASEIRGMALTIRDTTEMVQQQMRLEKLEREKERTAEELQRLKKIYTQTDIIGETDVMRRLKEIILNIAPTDATVLINGETGCGKEVVARAIYKNSKRRDAPYVRVNCAAIPESLMESELFGYEKGAFTGAQNRGKPGMFEMANGGTILLDEIGEMPLTLQPKLLRVLQEKEMMRLGGTEVIALDVRIIASTNQDLLELSRCKKFREDLYYRLNVVPLKIPPLRERKADILLMANRFLEKFNAKYGRNVYLSVPALSELELYDWPGNVRELENTIERLVVLSQSDMIGATLVSGTLNANDFLASSGEELKLDAAVERLECSMIARALEEYGSTYKAAEALGITQSRIVRKMKALNIEANKSKTI